MDSSPHSLNGLYDDADAESAARSFREGREDQKQATLKDVRERIGALRDAHPALQVAYFLERGPNADEETCAFLQQLIEVQEARSALLSRLGHLHALKGRPARALIFLEQGVDEGRFGRDMVLFTAQQYARIGKGKKACKLLDAASRMDASDEEAVQVSRQFCDFLLRFPAHTADFLFRCLERRFIPANWRNVEDAATAALRNRQGWLLLRLGDGEGSCLVIDEQDSERYSALYGHNRRQFLEIWFRDDPSGSKSVGFERAVDLFNDAIPTANCIGGVYHKAIETEFTHCSSRGIPWIVNAMRKLASISSANSGWLDATMVGGLTIHYDLLICGSFDRLIRTAEKVGIISCHTDLAVRLQRKYGLAAIEFMKIPGEQIHADVLGASATEGVHWPTRFDEVCQQCDSGDRRGQLFLVAAGLLGKIYASKLKKTGAVVIDIGAVADIWMGKTTRDWFPNIPAEYMLE